MKHLFWTSTTIYLLTALTCRVYATVLSSSSLPFPIDRSTPDGDADYLAPIFPILPFQKYSGNPVLTSNRDNDWESTYVYNPTAIILNETVFLLYRAQNASKTSSIGLAWSTDGYNFTRLSRPILYATQPWEGGGGTEDPRIVRVNGTFYLTYTAYDLNTPRLCIATSEDLLTWAKYPPLFPDSSEDVNASKSEDGARKSIISDSKSGAIVTDPTSDGLYHMYFGDSVFYHATSTDLVNWTASDEPFATPIYPWENALIEPGPAPIKTRDGRWLLIYNAMTTGQGSYQPGQYSVGQMLLDEPSSHTSRSSNPIGVEEIDPSTFHSEAQAEYEARNRQPRRHHDDAQIALPVLPSDNKTEPVHRMSPSPSPSHDSAGGPLARLETPFLVPSTPEEEKGQVDLVVFAEGLVQFKGRWFLYYGQADETVGVAVADVQPRT
ncbi:hypothetical protein LTR93_003870 [Exophiala xenobiotica]|nr:hypothetical protein LTR93_003870 [Exophiala xenobiotica]KAK5407239.1 hypothetical protein LTR06_007981 [Exophiala xenobiotica]